MYTRIHHQIMWSQNRISGKFSLQTPTKTFKPENPDEPDDTVVEQGTNLTFSVQGGPVEVPVGVDVAVGAPLSARQEQPEGDEGQVGVGVAVQGTGDVEHVTHVKVDEDDEITTHSEEYSADT